MPVIMYTTDPAAETTGIYLSWFWRLEARASTDSSEIPAFTYR